MSYVLTTVQAAAILKVSDRTIRYMITRGSIDAYKLDPTAKSIYFIPKSEIERILSERKSPRHKRPGKR